MGVVLVALDRDKRKVDVLAVVADADESFRELDRFESCDVLRVISHEECRRRVSNMRNGIAQWWVGPCRHESDRDELKLSLDTELPRLYGFCWISVILYAYSSQCIFRRLSERFFCAFVHEMRDHIRDHKPVGSSGMRAMPWSNSFEQAQALAVIIGGISFDEPNELVLAGVCRLLKLELWRQRPMPRVTRDSSIALQIITQSFLNCLVMMAYKNGLQHEFSGNTNTVNTLACSSDIKCIPNTAVNDRNAIGDQHKKSVNTSNAIRLAIRESFEFQACEPRIAQYIFK